MALAFGELVRHESSQPSAWDRPILPSRRLPATLQALTGASNGPVEAKSAASLQPPVYSCTKAVESAFRSGAHDLAKALAAERIALKPASPLARLLADRTGWATN